MIPKSSYLIFVVFIIALGTLAGWQYDIELLKRPLPHLVAMNPVSAVAFILSGISFLILSARPDGGRYTYIVRSLAVLISGIAILRLIAVLGYMDIQIDHRIYAHEMDMELKDNVSNHMGLNTAVCLALYSMALLLSSYRSARGVANYLATVVYILSLFALIGYVYNVREYYGLLKHIPMAIHTAVCFLLLAILLLIHNRHFSFVAVLTSPYAGSRIARILIPASIIVPLCLGYIRLLLQWGSTPISSELGVSFMTTSIIVVFLLLIYYIATAINKSDKARYTAEQSREKASRELQSIFDSGTQVSIISTNAQGLITHFSHGSEIMLGYTAEEMIGKHTPMTFHLESEVKIRAETLTSELQRPVHGFQALTEYPRQGQHETREWTYIRKDGTTLPVQIVVTPMHNAAHEISGFLGIATDLTERKLVEDGQRKYRELQVKNKEMEQFTYVASHDLREPLVTIASCAEMMQDQYRGRLGAEGDMYLGYMRQSTTRMMALITGLLDYSRIGNERHLGVVDFGEAARAVVSDLAKVIRDTQAVIEIDTLPVLNGYKPELHILFQNLISNAIKFRRDEVPPVIKISASQVGGKWIFRVQDNGIGIEEEDREQVFVIFKRLHNRSEIDGNGIGLAHCKKIVEMHNGSIWIESQGDHGSAFCFSLAA